MIFRVESMQKGRFRLIGELTFDTVPEASKKGFALFDRVEGEFFIDLQDVSHTDSAGLVLLIAWMRYAREKNKALQFLNIPAQMLALAKTSNLDQILPLRWDQELSDQLALGPDKKLVSPVR
jgi:phospholipid transport system transporter-binding protein